MVDDSLSDKSTNPVQNKVVTKEIRQLYEEIADLHETLFDISVNMIDNKSMVSGYYTTTTDTPTITENNSLKCILVEVEEEKQYTLSSMSETCFKVSNSNKEDSWLTIIFHYYHEFDLRMFWLSFEFY